MNKKIELSREQLREKYKEEYINSDFFLHTLDSFVAIKTRAAHSDLDESKKKADIKAFIEKQRKSTKTEKEKLAVETINEIQKVFTEETLKQNYNAFNMFSLDASDLAVLATVEDIVKEKKVPETTDKITKEIQKINKFVSGLDEQLKQAKKDRDLEKTQKLKETLHKIIKVEQEIKEEKWYKTPMNSIGSLQIGEE